MSLLHVVCYVIFLSNTCYLTVEKIKRLKKPKLQLKRIVMKEKVVQSSSAAKAIYGCGDIPYEAWLRYAKALMTIAGADGDISEGEMEWLMTDFVAIIDAPDSLVAELRKFNYKQAKLSDILPTLQFEVRLNYRRALLYDAIKMSFADNDYADSERSAVRASADLLGVPIYIAKTLEGLVNTEKSIEVTRRSIFELDVTNDFKRLEPASEGLRPASRFVQHTYGIQLTSDEIELIYGFALMLIAGADGEISKEEIEWYQQQYAPMAKVPPHIVAEVMEADYKTMKLEDVIANLQSDMTVSYAKTLLYNAIKMARADNDFPKLEREAVEHAARLLDIPVSIASTMNYLIDAEDKVDKMRKTLFEVQTER